MDGIDAAVKAKEKEITADKDKALEDAMNSRFGDEKETEQLISKGKGEKAAKQEAKEKKKMDALLKSVGLHRQAL